MISLSLELPFEDNMRKRNAFYKVLFDRICETDGSSMF